ncbi:6312_t:CDS:2, partial [Racocetra persica]
SSSAPSKRPLLWSQHDVSKKLLSLPQSKTALGDIFNQFLPVTYQDIKNLND